MEVGADSRRLLRFSRSMRESFSGNSLPKGEGQDEGGPRSITQRHASLARLLICSSHAAGFGENLPPMNRAVFLDRDGTLVVEKNYLSKVEDVTILPGAPAALKRLQDAGFLLFIVSNQSGVGRGYFTMADVERVNGHISELFGREGVRFQKIYVAPEAPDRPSRGRKPSPQFLFDARDDFGLDLSSSYVVGDKLIDLECGWNAGVKKSILVRTGYGAEQERSSAAALPTAVIVDSLAAAADWILSNGEGVR
jgi:D-glycero-D-manno-heptose 1,7-bisphosphate phosphatase